MAGDDQRGGRRLLDPLRAFLHAEAAGGVVLAVAAGVALVWANSPLAGSYTSLWDFELTIGIGPASIREDLRHWVNDGLMAVFFFVVGLEIKRELVTGELRDPRAALLPVLAAAGGVVLPALLFLAVTGGGPAAAGWGIPMATDIAFALGVLALLGERVPIGAKLFLLTIAIVDDILAITVIAVAYSDSISPGWLGGAVGGLLLIAGLRAVGVSAIWPYVPIGIAVWVATLESGVHATIAGVALGLLTPAQPVGGRDVLGVLEHRLHPVSAFAIVPLFALANAGVAVSGDALVAPGAARLAGAVVLGLLAGKTLGIAGTTLLARRLGLGVLPTGVTTRYVWGLAALAGIGFTVSLFIADLAYDTDALTDTAKIGILAGSLTAALLGAAILYPGRHPRPQNPPPQNPHAPGELAATPGSHEDTARLTNPHPR
ncbi:MAG: Na+/H+ antiporter NhaA [Actinomycetota bacterium]|nr:Na+/H+ antiporter NhaA [Actinomycetota bacterium]